MNEFKVGLVSSVCVLMMISIFFLWFPCPVYQYFAKDNLKEVNKCCCLYTPEKSIAKTILYCNETVAWPY